MPITLYLSDLDGTLLDRSARLPPEDAARINRLTAASVRISFATARTVRSVSTILGAIDFSQPGSAPVALMNGAMIRDMRTGAYLAVEKIPAEAVRSVLMAADSVGAEPFVYTADPEHPVLGDPLVTSYRRIANDAMRRFRDERIEKYGKPFLRFSSAADLPGETVYFCFLGNEALIRDTARAAEGIPGLKQTFYPDAYAPEVWYLELFAETASKRRAVEFLRSLVKADRVVVFGDNRNDLPMFEAADLAVAVSSAAEEIRAAADDVCENVPAYIAEDAGIAP